MTVWEKLTECVSQIDEPFGRSEILGWFRRHYPDVKESTLAAHIQAATANAPNRDRNFPHLARREPLLRRTGHGQYVRAPEASAGTGMTARAGAGTAADAPASAGGRLSRRTLERARSNVEDLVRDFDRYLAVFERSRLFTGPSLYFHERAIAARRCHASPRSLLADVHFLEYVYAVLPSWGMHRMGASAAKVTEFSQFVASLRSVAPAIGDLWPLRITTLAPADVQDVGRRVWTVIAAVRASASETQIVAGSKTLHHVLPDLLPPIDRQYTLMFFAGHKTMTAGDEQAFAAWFPLLAEIARRCQPTIDAAAARGDYMATSPAKVIDNAIVGFAHSRRAEGPAGEGESFDPASWDR